MTPSDISECVVTVEGAGFRVTHKGTGDSETADSIEEAHLVGMRLRVLAAYQRAYGRRPPRIPSGGA